MADTANAAAFVLDESVAVGDEGGAIAGIPGLWKHDQPVLASATGYTDEELRTMIAEQGLPLVEAKSAKDALEEFPPSESQLPSAQEQAGAAAPAAPRVEEAQEQKTVVKEKGEDS